MSLTEPIKYRFLYLLDATYMYTLDHKSYEANVEFPDDQAHVRFIYSLPRPVANFTAYEDLAEAKGFGADPRC